MKKNEPTLPITSDATILEIRLECKSQSVMRGVIKILEGALGAADAISHPYSNRDGEGKRFYMKFVVSNQGSGVRSR